jgi:hypothetical protein
MPLVIELGATVWLLPLPVLVKVIGSAASASAGLSARRIWSASTLTT